MKRVLLISVLLVGIILLVGCVHRSVTYEDTVYGVVKSTNYSGKTPELVVSDVTTMSYTEFQNTYPKHFTSIGGDGDLAEARVGVVAAKEHTYSMPQKLYEKWKGDLYDSTKVFLFVTRGSEIISIKNTNCILSDTKDAGWKTPYLFELAPSCYSYKAMKLPAVDDLEITYNSVSYSASFGDTMDALVSVKLTLELGTSILHCYGISFSEDADAPLLFVTDGYANNAIVQFDQKGVAKIYSIGGAYTFTPNGVQINEYTWSGGIPYFITTEGQSGLEYVKADEMSQYYNFQSEADCPFYDLYVQNTFSTSYTWNGSELVADGYLTPSCDCKLVLEKDTVITGENGQPGGELPAGTTIQLEKYGVKDNLMYFTLEGKFGEYHCALKKGLIQIPQGHL